MAVVANDAAEILAEALGKMDDLINISEDQLFMEGLKKQQMSVAPDERVQSLLNELKSIVERIEPARNIAVPSATASVLIQWLELTQNSGSKMNGIENGESTRAQIARLEADKESLILQVSVLTDQVEAQGEKIRELEFNIEEQNIKTEDMELQLEEERKKSVALVNEKLELVTEISSLKLSLSTIQEMHKDQEKGNESHDMSNNSILAEKELEIESLKNHIEALLDEQESLQKKQGRPTSGIKAQLREKASEVSKLNVEIEILKAANDEKDKRIQDMQQSMGHFKKVEDLVKKKAQRTASDGSQVSSPGYSSTDATSVHSHFSDLPVTPEPDSHPDDSGHLDTSADRQVFSESYMQAVGNPVTPSLRAIAQHNEAESDFHKQQQGVRASFGKGFFRTKNEPRSSSEPNLRKNAINPPQQTSPGKENQPSTANKQRTDESPFKEERKTGIRKSFGKAIKKLRRTTSLTMNQEERPAIDPIDLTQYHNQKESQGDQLELPFSKWSAQMVLSWLDDLGLGRYVEPCSRVISCGEDLIKATAHELEKNFGIRNPLHRKKLQLALQALLSEGPDLMGRLSSHWVLGWLEDIGLPQYKESFSEGCIDGRMLNSLTFDDLYHLKVVNPVHHVSIKRAIQCLRLHNFHPNCLKRYPIDESWQKGADVLLWTNGRVMEWLRLVDLAEYAPNLRGSGLHGTLMMLEPRFTAETLSALLSIPPGKTLLRRHLATHFNSLIGVECQKVKEQTQNAPGFAALMPGAKVKVPKKNAPFVSLRKRGKGGDELDDYVCPMDLEVPVALQSYVTQQRSRRSTDRSNEEYRERSRHSREEADDPFTAIGTFSQELDSLTHMLSQDSSARKGAVQV